MTSAPPDTPGASSLYVGGLDARICTELLHDVFSLAGTVTLCRVVSDKHTGASMGFGFVDYREHHTALKAKDLLNGRVIYGQALTVDWAHANTNAAAGRGAPSPAIAPAAPDRMVGDDGEDISNHYCLFIGNLDGSVTDGDLRSAFSAFGACSSAHVSRDGAANSRRCAFVSFKDRAAAQAAIDGLNGQVIADRPMRVDWARAKTNAATRAAAMGIPETEVGAAGAAGPGGAVGATPARPVLDFGTISQQTPPNFTTVYISGLPPNVDEDTLRAAFEIHGTVVDIRVPESARAHGGDKVYAFVVYAEHDCAARAIFDAQKGLNIADRNVAVQWGRESSRPPAGGPMGAALRGGGRPPPPRPGQQTGFPSNPFPHHPQSYGMPPQHNQGQLPSYSAAAAAGSYGQHRGPGGPGQQVYGDQRGSRY